MMMDDKSDDKIKTALLLRTIGEAGKEIYISFASEVRDVK